MFIQNEDPFKAGAEQRGDMDDTSGSHRKTVDLRKEK